MGEGKFLFRSELPRGRFRRFKRLIASVAAAAVLFSAAPRPTGKFINFFRVKEVMAETRQLTKKDIKATVDQAAKAFQSYSISGNKSDLKQFHDLTSSHMTDDAFRKPLLERMAVLAADAIKEYVLTGDRQFLLVITRFKLEFRTYDLFKKKLNEKAKGLTKDSNISKLLSMMKKEQPTAAISVGSLLTAANAAYNNFKGRDYESKEVAEKWGDDFVKDLFQRWARHTVDQAAKSFESYASSRKKSDFEKFKNLISDHLGNDAFRKVLLERMAVLTATLTRNFILTGERSYLNAAKTLNRQFGKDDHFRKSVEESINALNKDASISGMVSKMQEFSNKKNDLAGEPHVKVTVADLLKAAGSVYARFHAKDYLANTVRAQWGDKLVNELYRRFTKAKPPPARVVGAVSVISALQSFRSFVVDVDYGARKTFTNSWSRLNSSQRQEFLRLSRKDPRLARFAKYYAEATGDTDLLAFERMFSVLRAIKRGIDSSNVKRELLSSSEVMAHALRHCYQELKKGPDRKRVVDKHGENIVLYMESKLDDIRKAGWLSGSAKRVAKQLEQRRKKDKLVQDLLVYLGPGEKLEQLAARLLDVWSEVRKAPNRGMLEKEYGKAFVSLVADNRKELGFAGGKVKYIQAKLAEKKDSKLVRSLLTAWKRQVTANKELSAKMAGTFEDDLMAIRKTRREELVAQYSEDLVSFSERMDMRRSDARQVGGLLLILTNGVVGRDREMDARAQLARISRKYADDPGFSRLAVSLMDSNVRGGLEAYLGTHLSRPLRLCVAELGKKKPDKGALEKRYGKEFVSLVSKNLKRLSWAKGTVADVEIALNKRKSEKLVKGLAKVWGERTGQPPMPWRPTLSDFARHALRLKRILERDASRVYLRGLTGESLGDVETIMKADLKKMKGEGGAKWVAFIDGMERAVRAQYGKRSGKPVKLKWDDGKMKEAQLRREMTQKGHKDRMALDEMLSELDHTHTMTEDWARALLLHIARIKQNLASTSVHSLDYERAFAVMDWQGLGKNLRRVVKLLSARQADVAKLEKKYGKPLVDFVVNNSQVIHEIVLDYNIAKAKKRTFHWLDNKKGKRINLKQFYMREYASRMGVTKFQNALLAVQKGLWHYQGKKDALAAEYGRVFVGSVERNLDELKPYAAKWPESKKELDRLVKTVSALKELHSVTTLDLKSLNELEERANTILALHRQLFSTIVTGAELVRKLDKLGLRSFKEKENQQMFLQAVYSTAALSPANLKNLRALIPRTKAEKKAFGMKKSLADMPFDWQVRFLERYVPEVRGVKDDKALSNAYHKWIDRLERTMKDKSFTEKFEKTLFTYLLQAGEIKLAPAYNLPAGVRDVISIRSSGTDIMNQYLRLQPETRFEVYQAIRRLSGGTLAGTLNFLKSNEGLARFSSLCSSLAAMDQFYAPLLLRTCGDTILKYQPHEIQILINSISAYTQIFAKMNAYHMLYDYYMTLPKKIDGMFATVADLYRKGVMQPGVRVLQPSEQGEYQTIIASRFNLIVNIPKTVYRQIMASRNAAGQALIMEGVPILDAGPLPAPVHDAVKHKFHNEKLVNARINVPLPEITAPLAIAKSENLAPDVFPKGNIRNVQYLTERGITYDSNRTSDPTTGTWREEAKIWGYGKEATMNVNGTFTNPWHIASTALPLLGVGTLGAVSPKAAATAAPLAAGATSLLGLTDGITVDRIESKGRNFGSLNWWWGAFPQEPGGVTNWDILLQKNSVTRKMEDMKIFFETVTSGGPDTIIDIERKMHVDGEFRYTMHTYKRFGKFYKDDSVIPLTQQEGQLYFQRMYNSGPDVWKTEAGYLAPPWGRGPFGSEHAFIFADSGKEENNVPAGGSQYQGGGLWTPIGRKGGFMGAYELTREGRGVVGGGMLDPDAQVIAFGRGHFAGTSDPTRWRGFLQYSEIAPRGGGPVAGKFPRWLGLPWKPRATKLDAFLGAGVVATARTKDDGTPVLDKDGKQVLDKKVVPMGGAVAQAIHKQLHWKLGGLYTPEYFGGSGFIGSRDGLWAVAASATRRKLEEIYIKEALFGEYQPGDANYKKPDMSILTGQIIDASLGTQLFFPPVPLKVIAGGAGYYYEPSATKTGQSVSSLLQADPKAMEDIFRNSIINPGSLSPVRGGTPPTVLYALNTPYATTKDKEWAAAGVAEFTLLNNVLNTSELSFRGFYLRSKTGIATTQETARSGGMAGAQFKWRPFSVEGYVEAAKRKEKLEFGGAGEIKWRLETSPKLSLSIGGYRSGLANIAGGGHASFLVESTDGTKELLGVGTFNEGYQHRTAEGALGIRLRTSPTLDFTMFASGIWQRDIEKSLDAFQGDFNAGLRYLKIQSDLMIHLYTGLQYWTAKRKDVEVTPEEIYTISRYRAFLRNIWDWYGLNILRGNLRFEVELGGGKMREYHRMFVDISGNIIFNW